jgi:prepilin-type N-terminal cleavage/methylation domain-containing protein
VSARLGISKSGSGRVSNRRDERGFTILELLIVLAIASLAATTAIPAYFSRSEVTLDNATRLFVDDLRQAQIRAVYRNAPVEVRFEADGDGYSIIDLGTGSTATLEPIGTGRRYSQDAVFEGVHLSALDIGSARSLTFGADGTTAPGGRITVEYHGDARMVTIEPVHGTICAPELETCALRGRH